MNVKLADQGLVMVVAKEYTMNRKRQIMVNELLADLQEMYEEMVEAALEYSDLREAKEVIAYIMQK